MVSQSENIPARPKEAEQFIDQFLSTVCDASRRHILELLSTSPECSAGEIATHLGLAASTTSEHLKELLQLRLLTARKEGKKTYYQLRSHELVQLFHGMITSLENHYHQGILPPPTDGEI